MARMGKTQELIRNFRPLSALAFVVILQGTWEVLLAASYQGLQNGGLAGLIWSYIWTFVGMLFVNVSLAEMASMAPTSGGQYHWVSEFAPPRFQRFLSYQTGWMSTLSWQAGTASGPFLVGTMIQSLVIENNESYSPSNWQGTLIVIAITIMIYFINVYGVRIMPMFQNVMLVVHVSGFLIIMIVFWVLSPRVPAKTVFLEFTNSGGWGSIGVSLMVGQISSLYACICADAAAHMSEEIEDAGVTVPRAMMGSYFVNGGIGIVFLISFLFTITSVTDALNEDYPFIFVFRQTVSVAGINGLTSILIILIFAGTMSYNLSTSRQTWAFARDGGLPFSEFISAVHPTMHVPVNAVLITCVLTAVLSLINIGSEVTFNAIISLNLVSLMITYTISIGCVLYRRITAPETLPPCRWSLGHWGVPINAIAVAYSTVAFFWCFWPPQTPVDKETFNWAVVMFLAVALLSTVDYVRRARKVYKGPVVLVEQQHECSM
ncbi:amino acid transporter [Pseudovirgaria hyperparasitica]|uniref:Amino acid transporter n=1 Tax=Pseudovirgaria hyperparasitica TaxID=470096 RepID=A0A6A6WLD0_9PEZI|nr:amino acid transporter [Pseudovirgaria hyperparasitica]KAF2762991.1 amino acid transporter [Pseudovirgaria hyperparasitica]